MLWLRSLGVPVLAGVIVEDWSPRSSQAVRHFCRKHAYSSLLLRIDKRNQRWTKRRGGYILDISAIPSTVQELAREAMIALLLEPVSPYRDMYSLTAVTDPERNQMVVEVVGPGFDASDILRSDLLPHERWIVRAPLGMGTGQPTPTRLDASRTHQIPIEEYRRSVTARLAKIGARARNPAFPDLQRELPASESGILANEGAAFLRNTKQVLLLNHLEAYTPIAPGQITSFAKYILKLLSGLAGYGVYLGPSSFAASVLPRRGIVFWDFFPARHQEAAALYPAAS